MGSTTGILTFNGTPNGIVVCYRCGAAMPGLNSYVIPGISERLASTGKWNRVFCPECKDLLSSFLHPVLRNAQGQITSEQPAAESGPAWDAVRRSGGF